MAQKERPLTREQKRLIKKAIGHRKITLMKEVMENPNAGFRQEAREELTELNQIELF